MAFPLVFLYGSTPYPVGSPYLRSPTIQLAGGWSRFNSIDALDGRSGAPTTTPSTPSWRRALGKELTTARGTVTWRGWEDWTHVRNRWCEAKNRLQSLLWIHILWLVTRG